MQKFVARIFEGEQHVIFVAVVGAKDDTLRNDIDVREGVSLYYPKQYIREFVHMTPLIIIGALEKLKPALGEISSILVRYEKRVLLFSRYEDMIVVLRLDARIPTPVPDSIAKLVAQAGKESQ